GAIRFTAKDYPLDAFCERLRSFATEYDVPVYLEPGEAAVRHSAPLEVSVLDVGYNGKHLAVVDASTEAHMLDVLIYRESAPVGADAGDHQYMVCGKPCLAGDVFGEGRFANPLQIGDRISIGDAAGYTMVKKNWFNGVNMPSIAVKEVD